LGRGGEGTKERGEHTKNNRGGEEKKSRNGRGNGFSVKKKSRAEKKARKNGRPIELHENFQARGDEGKVSVTKQLQ